jgi:2-polyprenyl-3-methyl-5-hydroxy-6-metoxy-1,4-benzoquinol methylase
LSSSLYGAEFFAGRSPTVTASAEALSPLISRLLAPDSVLDLGCGQGEWLESLRPFCKDLVGVDIAAPEGYVRHDLTTELDLGRTFDLVLCLEVGEHLPAEAADTLVDTVVRHAGSAVLWSAAVVGQEGIGHINCQPHGYWHAKFEERGFVTQDTIRPLIYDNHAISPWYRNNIFLYLREDV